MTSYCPVLSLLISSQMIDGLPPNTHNTLQQYCGPTCNTGWLQNDYDNNDGDDRSNFGLGNTSFSKKGDKPSLSRSFECNSVSLYSPNCM